MTHSKSIAFLLVTIVCLSGCMPAKRLTVPETSEVDRLEITWGSLEQHRRRIEDRETIEAFAEFVREHNHGMRKYMNTFPVEDFSVLMKRDELLLLVVWVGSDWIGGRDGGEYAPANRLRPLSVADREEVLRVLQLSDE